MVKKTTEQKKAINNLEKFYNSREDVINFFRDYIEILSHANCNAKQNKSKGAGLTTLAPKQMPQRLPLALAHVKAGNNSESSSNEIVYFLYQSKQITKKVCKNIIKSMQWNFTQICIKMDTTFMNSENSKTSKHMF